MVDLTRQLNALLFLLSNCFVDCLLKDNTSNGKKPTEQNGFLCFGVYNFHLKRQRKRHANLQNLDTNDAFFSAVLRCHCSHVAVAVIIAPNAHSMITQFWFFFFRQKIRNTENCRQFMSNIFIWFVVVACKFP